MKTSIVILIFLGASNLLFSQLELPLQVLCIGGGTVENNDIKLEFTMGEPVADLIENSNFYINQGFQQAHFGNVDLTVPTVIINSGLITVYPNPIRDRIYIRNSGNLKIDRIAFRDILGQTLLRIAGSGSQESIRTNSLPAGIYWMTIYLSDRPHELIKLIKI